MEALEGWKKRRAELFTPPVYFIGYANEQVKQVGCSPSVSRRPFRSSPLMIRVYPPLRSWYRGAMSSKSLRSTACLSSAVGFSPLASL